MFKPKKKISRKELKEDKLVTWYFKVTQFYDSKKSIINYITGGLIVVVLIAFFVFIKPRTENQKLANVALSSVMGFYDYKNYGVAIEGVPERGVIGLKQIVDEYGSTEAGQVSKIYLGNCYFAMNNYDEALKCFEDYNGSNKLFKVSAFSGIASVYEAKKQFADAAKYFEKAAEVANDELQTPENLFFAARNYKFLGDKEKAIKLFDQIKTKYRKSSYARDIDRYIAEVKD